MRGAGEESRKPETQTGPTLFDQAVEGVKKAFVKPPQEMVERIKDRAEPVIEDVVEQASQKAEDAAREVNESFEKAQENWTKFLE